MWTMASEDCVLSDRSGLSDRIERISPAAWAALASRMALQKPGRAPWPAVAWVKISSGIYWDTAKAGIPQKAPSRAPATVPEE